MFLKSAATAFALASSLFFALPSVAAIPPLSQELREAYASHILTGYVVSIRKDVQYFDYGSNALYTVGMIVNHVDKGSNTLGGKTIYFQYWKALDRPSGWCGNSGQIGVIKHYKVIKAYLSFDERSNKFNLLNPNGFDEVSL